MRIAVIGAGAAARAVAQRLEEESGDEDLWLLDWDQLMVPGCPDIEFWQRHIADATREEGIDLAVVLDRLPLADGIIDVLTAAGLTCFGPTRAAASITASTEQTQELLADTGLPTIDQTDRPLVDLDEAGEGDEYLVWAFCDGARARLWPAVRRYHRARDGGRGPATEGMGAATLPTSATARTFDQDAATAVLGAFSRRGVDYRGLLVLTIRATAAGPAVLDLDTHWGDPETQALLAVLDGPLLPLLTGSAAGAYRDQGPVPVTGDQSVQVTLTDPDYPNPTLPWTTDVLPSDTAVPFDEAPHATRPARRRLTIGGTGAGVEAARAAAYGNIGTFATQFVGGLPFHYRRDIAADLLPAIDSGAVHHTATSPSTLQP
jgi:phosphoribosylamine---glycine ligase